jgi:MYXO-CTERM domain-containing protein
VVPDIPCNVWGCDHNANANQINALLDWAVAQSMTPSSRLAGAVDATRRGLIGHSWGALGSAMAASRNTGVASLVLFDPNDDALVGARNAPGIRAPTLTLLAQTRAVCNNQWVATSITPGLGGPGVHATLARSGHCDPEDPTDALCPLLCGSGDVATTALFRRYAVAWTRCNLTGDAAMAPWVLGADWDADQRAGRLTGVVRAGAIAGLACLRGDDAGAPDDVPIPDDVPTVIDAGSVAAEDDVVSDVVTADLVTSPDAPISDAGARADAGTNARGAGCGCAAGETGSHPSLGLLALLGLRRRRAPRRA